MDYESPRLPSCKGDFQEIEKILYAHSFRVSINTMEVPKRAVLLLTKLAFDQDAHQRITIEQTRLMMATRIERLVSPSETAIRSSDLDPPPRRRRSMGV